MSDQAAPPADKPIRIEVAAASSSSGDDFTRMSPDQFNARLQEATEAGARQILKAVGIPKEQRKAMMADIEAGRYVLMPKPKDGEPDYKAEYEKLSAVAKEHETAKARLAKHGEFFKKLADDTFAALPESAQKYIAARAGDDPEQRLAEINALKESGLLAAPSGEAPKPATTMANPGPSTPKPEGQKSAFEKYEEIKKSGNRVLAARFRGLFGHAIDQSAPNK